MESSLTYFILFFLLSLYPEASEEGEESQEEAAGGAGVWVKEEGESGGRSETLVLPLSWAAALRQQQQQERYDRMFAGLFQGLFFLSVFLSFGLVSDFPVFLKLFPLFTHFFTFILYVFARLFLIP